MSGPAAPYGWTLGSDLPATVANWTVIEDAIQAQIVAGSGLGAARVIWTHQTADRPNSDFIALEHLGSELSAPATPEITQRDNPDSVPDDGEELILASLDQIDFSIRVHFYTATASGAGSARSRLSAVRGFLGAESVSDELDLNNIAMIECGPVQPLPAILETKFESRAFFDGHFRTVEGYEEKQTFIETVNPTFTTTL